MQPLQTLLDNLGKFITHYGPKYDNFMLFGDFNAEEMEDKVNEFMDSYNLTNLVKSPTCFKSNSPKCIDLILTNRKKSIQTTTTVETGLSDFHTMGVSVVKSKYQKERPSIINYRNYKDFKLEDFRKDLRLEINKLQANKAGG